MTKYFKIPASVLLTILILKNEIKKPFKKEKPATKKNKAAKYHDLEECLVKWFKQSGNLNAAFSVNMLKVKA